MYRAGGAPSPELATWVSSSWRETVTVESHRDGFTRAILGEAAVALADRTVPLESLWGSAARAAATRLRSSGDHAMSALSLAVIERGRSRADPDRLIPRVVQLAGSQRTVRDIADDVGLSERQLFRRCVDEMGTVPNTSCAF